MVSDLSDEIEEDFMRDIAKVSQSGSHSSTKIIQLTTKTMLNESSISNHANLTKFDNHPTSTTSTTTTTTVGAVRHSTARQHHKKSERKEGMMSIEQKLLIKTS